MYLDYLRESQIIKNENNINEGYTEEDDAVMEAFESIECYDQPETAMYRIAMESVEDFHDIIDSIKVLELSEYMSTNEEVVYEEGKVATIVKGIITLIQQAWQKLKGVFDKMLSDIQSWVKQDEKFIKKYEKQILESNAIFYTEWYHFNLKAIQSPICDRIFNEFIHITDRSMDNVSTEEHIQDEIHFLTNNEEGGLSEILRRKALEDDKAYTPNNRIFGNGLILYFGMSKANNMEKIKYKKNLAPIIIDEIKTASASKKAAKASYDSAKKGFSKIINDVKKHDKKTESKQTLSLFSAYSTACKNAIAICNIALAYQMKAIKASHAQARRIAMEVIKYDKGKETVKESVLDKITLQ